MTDMAHAVDGEARALMAIFEAAREQAQTHLSASQLQALIVVSQDEGLNMRALASGLGVILSSASRLCDRLVAAGMLDRDPSPLDRREVTLRLTSAGRDLLQQLRDERRLRIEAVLVGMAPAARGALLRGLREFSRAAARREIMKLPA
ncbi:MarR family transcriptional regulator [Luedemannella helvata]|uniref:MarR family transcriptional regulator n=2 Tax=Luedemannella helvata TaxID=349315 RepID=A0ABP4W2E9_9ACTN